MQRKIADSLFVENRQRGYQPGDEAAHRAAAALGDRFDAPTLIALADAMAFTIRIGGQLQVTTLREYVDDIEGQVLGEGEAGGHWETMGATFHYETRDAKLARAKPPKEILGVPVADFEEPATPVAVPEAPEDEHDLRDQIEAEAEALPDDGVLDLSFEEPGPGVFEDAEEPVAAE